MKFEERAVADSTGWSLAHSIMCGGHRLPKGTCLDADVIDLLLSHGIEAAACYRLDDGDLDEDAAAHKAATAICGDGLKVEDAGRGRANLIALSDGVFMPGGAIDAVNRTDDAFSAASLRAFEAVTRGQLVATVKLVPYSLPAARVADLAKQAATASVAAFRPFSACLVTSGPAATDKTLATLGARLERLGGSLDLRAPVGHTVAALAAELTAAAGGAHDMILMLGASAISDRQDVFPAGLEAAGGAVTKVGMPADPGNLLMIGRLRNKTVIGLPGCARSPAMNGLDWILERFAAKLPVDHDTITALGTGGLLKEMTGRPVPRKARARAGGEASQFGAIILAAGRSSRAGGANKLLSQLGRTTVLGTTLTAVARLRADATLVVTGHAADKVGAIASEAGATIVNNPAHQDGMGTSIACGIAGLPDGCDFALICLGDMPFVRKETYQALRAAASRAAGPAIYVPCFHGKRGHPVLWHRHFFSDLKALDADTGGKALMRLHADKVIEVPVDDPGILIDLDTPEMLAQFGITPAGL